MSSRLATFKEYVKSISIVSPGGGYSETPTVIIPPPDGTGTLVNATATATLAGGQITNVTMVETGNGYVTAPVPYVVGYVTQFTVTTPANPEIDAGTYTDIPVTTDSVDGVGLSVTVVVDSLGAATISVFNNGNALYKQGDRINIQPIDMGGMEGDPEISAIVTQINNGAGCILSAEIDKVYQGDVYVQPKISALVPNQLPEVFQEDYPLFQTFIAKYYEFLEKTNETDSTKHGPLKVIQDFLSKLDVDFNDDGSPATDDNFLVEFFKDYAKDFPLNQSAKLTRVLKDINSFYTAKGSPKAIEYLFKVLYNEKVNLKNSGQFVLRPSSNTWNQDYVVKVYSTGNYDPSDLQGARIDLHYAVSEGAATNYYIKTTTCQKSKKIAYTNPQVWELTLDLPASFQLVGPGVGQAGYDEQLHAYVGGNISSIIGYDPTGAPLPSSGFANPTSTVVDGTYIVTESDYQAYMDVPYKNNTVYNIGDFVKANNNIYVSINEGTSDSSGSGPTHESGVALDGTAKFRFVSFESHKTTTSSGAAFEIVITGNAVTSVTRLGKVLSVTNVGAADPLRTEGIYTVSTFTSSGNGTGARFRVSVDSAGGITSITPVANFEGSNFRIGETVTVPDSELGSGGAADLTFDIADIICGENYCPAEIFEVPSTFFGGTGTPSVFFKVDTIVKGKIADILIVDGGSGFSANPAVTIVPDPSDTITTPAVLDTRLSDGTISNVLFVSNQQGLGYNNRPDLKINVSSVLTYITLEGQDGFFNVQAYPTRVLKSAKFNSIFENSSITDGGFRKNDVFKISESGDILGVYALDYFAEDYTLTGIANNGYIKITKVGDDGYPTAFDIIAVGNGYIRADFQFNITSATGQVCVVDLKTGYNAVLAGVFKDAGSFVSDANRLFDNRIYQNFSYEIETERPQTEWNDYVKRAAHPIGFGVFGNLQIRQSVDISSTFAVETDVYMFFKYPDIEEILVDEEVAKFFHKSDSMLDSVFPGDGFASRANAGSVVNKMDVQKVNTDTVGVQSEFGPYTFQGSEVENYYATSDGSTTGDPYFFQYPDPEDDFVERFSTGDYFLEDYVLLGNPYKDITMLFDSTNVGGYATDYFLEDYVTILNADPERGTALTFVDDVITSLQTQITIAGGDSVEFSETIVLSFIFFRTPSDSVELDDTSILFERGRLVEDSVSMEDDAVELTKEKLQESRVVAVHDFAVDLFSKVLSDTFDVDDAASFDVTTTAGDSTRVLQTVSIEPGRIFADAFTASDDIDKFDIGVVPSDTMDMNDALDKLDVGSVLADTSDIQDAVDLRDIGSSSTDTFDVADAGNLISQSFTVDLSYFAEDYVADTVVNF